MDHRDIRDQLRLIINNELAESNPAVAEIMRRVRESEDSRRAGADEHFRTLFGRSPSEEERTDYAADLAAIMYGKELQSALNRERPDPQGAA